MLSRTLQLLLSVWLVPHNDLLLYMLCIFKILSILQNDENNLSKVLLSKGLKLQSALMWKRVSVTASQCFGVPHFCMRSWQCVWIQICLCIAFKRCIMKANKEMCDNVWLSGNFCGWQWQLQNINSQLFPELWKMQVSNMSQLLPGIT